MIYKQDLKSSYTKIPNLLFTSEIANKLDIYDRWLYVYIISKPAEWRLNIRVASKECGICVNRICKSLRNLVKHNFLARRKVWNKDEARSEMEYFIKDGEKNEFASIDREIKLSLKELSEKQLESLENAVKGLVDSGVDSSPDLGSDSEILEAEFERDLVCGTGIEELENDEEFSEVDSIANAELSTDLGVGETPDSAGLEGPKYHERVLPSEGTINKTIRNKNKKCYMHSNKQDALALMNLSALWRDIQTLLNRKKNRRKDKEIIREELIKEFKQGKSNSCLKAYYEYVEYRRVKNKGRDVSIDTLKRIHKDFNKFVSQGLDIEEIVRQTIKKGWIGLFTNIPMRKENGFRRAKKRVYCSASSGVLDASSEVESGVESFEKVANRSGEVKYRRADFVFNLKGIMDEIDSASSVRNEAKSSRFEALFGEDSELCKKYTHGNHVGSVLESLEKGIDLEQKGDE